MIAPTVVGSGSTNVAVARAPTTAPVVNHATAGRRAEATAYSASAAPSSKPKVAPVAPRETTPSAPIARATATGRRRRHTSAVAPRAVRTTDTICICATRSPPR
jgi:hypothetical protein